MFQLPKLPFSNPFSYFNSRSIKLPSVKIDDIETSSDRRARTLKHLLKANHANHSIIYHNLRFHNHCPHILGSAYLLGSTSEHLNDIYDKESKQLEGWKDAPGEVTGGDWREYLGKREYQRAFVDLFEDELVRHNYDWKSLLNTYLFDGEEPVFNSLIEGLAHPLIHLGYGYELNSQTVAIEALAMACCFYGDMHKYIDDPAYSKPPAPEVVSASPLELLQKIQGDRRFDSLNLTHPGSENAEKILAECEDVVLEYWNAWTLPNPKDQFQQSQEAAVALLVGTHDERQKYDFFLLHLLTSSHAIRILLPLIPAKFEISLVRQWWLFAIITYVCQLRPQIEMSRIHDVKLDGRDWKFIDHAALAGKYSLDPHYVKALRALKEANNTWGEHEHFWLKAAVKFAEDFSDWFGFGLDEEMEKNANTRD
ncbi:hypothetical protein, variant [Verruconis gallopava]|uniref:Apoptosis regulator Bcl-2 family BH4 domain-containing protein n=1 Tax=Verruconis gallopava TaxID=253628 RepID=A0A0D2AM94_9PEZI|nr:uncharacterized protein PV09_01534 [Verruconis gallopava]XP_016217450.1 hypothetical protein, variant [Verruconis gallopava]KIW07580.1 hypothetical protein PV09_01534 [Verruconis gallopava]KIW07581.1 hypothetical protein, variant [Verruconis gallopava]